MTLNLAGLLRRRAASRPLARALLCGDRARTYGELDAAVRRLAAALARRGLGRGRPIAVMLPNTVEFTLTYFAAHTLGAPVVPLHIQLVPEEIAFHLEDSGAVMLVAEHEAVDRATAAITRTGRAVVLLAAGAPHGTGGAGSSPEHGPPGLEALLSAERDEAETAPTRPDDTAVILYTSGTTGRPKGAELSHYNLHENARVVAGPMLSLDDTTVALCALPLSHSFGQTVTHNAVLMAGGTVVLLPRFDEAAAVDAIVRHGVTFFAGVPTMYVALRRAAAARGVRLGAITLCVSGGAPLPAPLFHAFEEEHGITIRESYGLSETSPVASFNRLDRPARPGSIGVPIEGVEFRLAAGDGSLIDEPLVPGEILIRGPNVMKGYLGRPEATAEAMTDGWLRTGDIAHRDADGWYHIIDRRKDLILRGGYNVYPREVEEALYGHPAVAEAAVVGVPHPELGEEIKAIVVLRDGRTATPDEIIAHCRARLAPFKTPRLVEFRDHLPKGPSGKILRRSLRG